MSVFCLFTLIEFIVFLGTSKDVVFNLTKTQQLAIKTHFSIVTMILGIGCLFYFFI